MDPRAYPGDTPGELELWTRDDAEVWKEVEINAGFEAWEEDDCVLDNDLWMDTAPVEELSVAGLRRLGIRMV